MFYMLEESVFYAEEGRFTAVGKQLLFGGVHFMANNDVYAAWFAKQPVCNTAWIGHTLYTKMRLFVIGTPVY